MCRVRQVDSDNPRMFGDGCLTVVVINETAKNKAHGGKSKCKSGGPGKRRDMVYGSASSPSEKQHKAQSQGKDGTYLKKSGKNR